MAMARVWVEALEQKDIVAAEWKKPTLSRAHEDSNVDVARDGVLLVIRARRPGVTCR